MNRITLQMRKGILAGFAASFSLFLSLHIFRSFVLGKILYHGVICFFLPLVHVACSRTNWKESCRRIRLLVSSTPSNPLSLSYAIAELLFYVFELPTFPRIIRVGGRQVIAQGEIQLSLNRRFFGLYWSKERRSYENTSTYWLAGVRAGTLHRGICRDTMARDCCR